MQKLLLLGGSAQQIIAIETAKRMGLYTILCDYLPDNPGQYVADEFLEISTTDKAAILKVAKQEKVDGIIAYASDPAAPTAAFVAEKLGLQGNPYLSVEMLCNKNLFRDFLKENGFNAPQSRSYENIEMAVRELNKFHWPVVIKPVDSSGSKGISILHSDKGVEEAVKFAFLFSRSHKIIIEEYIEKAHTYLVGGDIFVKNGEIIMWGLMNCHRDASVNALVPVGKSYPLELEKVDELNIRNTLQRMVDKLKIKNGAMNVELVVDKEHRVWLIDVGPRNGGNMIPDLLGYIFNVDVVEWSIRVAMGQPIEAEECVGNLFFATYNLHVNKNGIYHGIDFSPEIEPYIIRKAIYKKVGDEVEYFDNAAKTLGIIFLKFNSYNEMSYYLRNMNDWIKIKVV